MQKDRTYYENLVKHKKDYKMLRNHFLQAFIFGGLLCLVGQVVLQILNQFCEPKDAMLYLLMIFITFAAILSAFGVYDTLGQVAKCGLAIPITGFSNACVSAAMEYRKEGLVLGIGSNCLKLAGSVIVLGTVCALVVSSIRYLFWVIS